MSFLSSFAKTDPGVFAPPRFVRHLFYYSFLDELSQVFCAVLLNRFYQFLRLRPRPWKTFPGGKGFPFFIRYQPRLAFHLIRHGLRRATFPSMGRLFWVDGTTSRRRFGFPLRGSCRKAADEVAFYPCGAAVAVRRFYGNRLPLYNHCHWVLSEIGAPPHPSRLAPRHLPLKGKAFIAAAFSPRRPPGRAGRQSGRNGPAGWQNR